LSEENTVIEVAWEGEVDRNRLVAVSEAFRRRCNIPPQAMIDILLGEDKLLAELNREYRDIAGPTDVLAFEMGKDETDSDDHWILGQVVVSCDRAAEQARELGVSFEEEMARLTVHGLLHLAGYDHESEAERSTMDDVGDKILDEAFSGKIG
jgi:probable rRNA maturation factor